MPTLADYIRHAATYGGLRDCWEAAWDDLSPVELGELALALRELGQRRRRVGRNGRTVYVERFTLTREETAELVERLAAAGLGDVDIRRFTGIASRNKSRTPANPLPRESVAVRAPATADRSHVARACAWCSAPLPAILRADAHYCTGGRCKMAAHRARQAEAA
jgi:hypothetical protein